MGAYTLNIALPSISIGEPGFSIAMDSDSVYESLECDSIV